MDLLILIFALYIPGCFPGTTVSPPPSVGDHLNYTTVAPGSSSAPVRTLSKVEELQRLLTSEQYDGYVRPGEILGEPTIVYLDFLIIRLSSFREAEMEYEATLYFRQTWEDFRLAEPTRNESIALSYTAFSKLWVPDTFFSNEKSAYIHTVTVPNRLISIDPKGTIVYSQKITVKLGCEFLLHKFPHDNQTCRIVMESYGYTEEDIVYRWKNVPEPVQMEDNMLIPEFQLTGHSIADCSKTYVTGTFSCRYAELYLSRDLGYYITRVFIPSILIVGLSWVSFWIDYQSVPARITLGLLTVLTITTQASSITSRLPAVSYVKAVDVWMSTCLMFVFAGLVEYSVVNVLSRDLEEQHEPIKNVRGPGTNQQQDGNRREADGGGQTRLHKCLTSCFHTSNKAIQADKVSRVLFPGMFFIFNVCYWAVYYGVTV